MSDFPDEFFQAYVNCALWSSNDPETENPLDDGFDESDIDDFTLNTMLNDCRDFYVTHKALLERTGCTDISQHGHDFWLTRNGHGAGFWDRGYPDDIGNELTDAAKVYGFFTLFVGDDYMIYHL
jgi:hypothetical protein